MPVQNVDVLVVGGGFTGILVLDELIKQNYNAVLVTEGLLGNGQSLHQHGYIHSGYSFPIDALVSSTVKNSPFWKSLLKQHNVTINEESYYGAPESFMNKMLESWNRFNLEYRLLEPNQVPSAYVGGSLSEPGFKWYAIKQPSADFAGLFQKIAAPLQPFIRQGKVTKLNPSSDLNIIQNVEITTSKNEKVTISAKAVILTTGVGTRKVLESIDRPKSEEFTKSVESLQNMKHIPMICIEGSNEVVPLVTGFFPQPGFLVVAHENQPKPGHNLLYITPFVPTHKITREAADGNAEAPEDPASIKSAIDLLFKASPKLKENADKLNYLVYFGLKQEHPTGVGSYVESFETTKNLILCLPTFWTLCSEASEKAVQKVKELVVPSSTKTTFSEKVPIGAVEYSKHTWHDWKTFSAKHKL